MFNCTFEGCDLSNVKIYSTSLREVTFLNCKMLGLDFSTANTVIQLAVSFRGCQLDYSAFTGLVLTNTKFIECSLAEVDFTDAKLKAVDFSGSKLHRAIFSGTNLEKADFRTAQLYQIDPADNYLKGAKFSYPQVLGLLEKYGIVVD